MVTKGNAVQEEIRRVAIRIKTPERWTKDVFARTKQGNAIGYDSPAASKWCIVGACRVEHGSVTAEREIWRAIGWTIPTFNDAPTTTHADVMRVLRKAFIAAGKEKR